MSQERNYSIEVQVITKTKEDVAPGSTIVQDSQFVVINPLVNAEKVHEVMAYLANALDPNQVPVPEEPIPDPEPDNDSENPELTTI